MSRLKISDVGKTFIGVIVILTACIGCATVWDDPLPPPSQRTKSEVQKLWGPPTKIYTDSNKLKDGADEVWIYKNPKLAYPTEPLVEERLYFKDGVLIKREGITMDSF